MKSKNMSQAFLRKRKMMLVMPLLVVPFLTMAFWALGGGSNGAKVLVQTKGLNLNLPSANLENAEVDKLSFYEKAQKDSARLKEWMRNDPYYANSQEGGRDTLPSDLRKLNTNTASKFRRELNPSPYENGGQNPEDQLLQKLSLLQNELDKPTSSHLGIKKGKADVRGSLKNDVADLDATLPQMQTPAGEDPEIKQLSSTLDKILDIQHPDRVKERVKQISIQKKGVVFPIETSCNKNSTSLLGVEQDIKVTNRFYGLEDNPADTLSETTIEAVVHKSQSLVQDAVIQLRLLTNVFLNGNLIAKGTLVNGVVSLNGERLIAEIKSIRSGKSIYPVSLSVYDMDGIEGLYVPGSITREAAKNTADNSLQLIELTSMNPSLKAQAAASGITAAKSLLSKKVKQVKVSVKSGYKVLLKNKNE